MHQENPAVAFFQMIAGFALAVLVMAGVGGSLWHLMDPEGMLARAFGRGPAGGLGTVIALLVAGFCCLLVREWIPNRLRNRYSELFVYAFAAAGAYYAFELFSRGGA